MEQAEGHNRRSAAIVLLANLAFLANALPMAVVGLVSHGTLYYLRSTDFFLARECTRAVFAESPGIENVLLPGIGFVAKQILALLGLEYAPVHYYFLSIVPYLAFFLATTWVFAKPSRPWFTVAVCAALFGSGAVPYMLTWGGYADGVSYLLILLAFLWMPRSIPLALLVVALATLNHYLGTFAILVTAAAFFIDRGERRYLVIIGWGVATLLASQLVWWLAFPDAAWVRVTVLVGKLQAGWGLLREVYGPTPWNLLSPLKLTLAPVLFAIAHRSWLPWRTRVAIALPLVAGALSILAFVDVTRTATHFFIISFLLTLSAMQREANSERGSAAPGDTARKIFQIAAWVSVLLPCYYVNNGAVTILGSTALGAIFSWLWG